MEEVFDENTKQKIFQQIIDIFVIPEIERRNKMSKLPKDLVLEKIQIIFSQTGRNYVRINKEVKAIIKCKINKPVKKDEIIYENYVDKIESIELTDGDLNYGHFTMLLFKGNWINSFNFVYNKKRIREHIEASKEFYESTKDNLEKKRLRPFYENAFASAELSTQSILLSLPNLEKTIGKDHEKRKNFLKDWTNLGNVKVEFSTVLSKLNSLRSSARYLSQDNFKRENHTKFLPILEEMIKFSEDLIK